MNAFTVTAFVFAGLLACAAIGFVVIGCGIAALICSLGSAACAWMAEQDAALEAAAEMDADE